jgi:hypothetical protein
VREAFFPKMTVLKEEAAEDVSVCVVSGLELGRLQAVFRIRNRIRIHRIHMFLGLPDPDPSIVKQK